MKIKSLKDLRSKLEKAITDSLEKEVYEMVITTERSHTDTDVYKKYKPKVYVRRLDEGGLRDIRNMVYDKSKTKNGILEVENITKYNIDKQDEDIEDYLDYDLEDDDGNDSGFSLTALIEYGVEKLYPGTEERLRKQGKEIPPYGLPRPFISNTKKEIKEENKFPKALKKGLKRNGIDID